MKGVKCVSYSYHFRTIFSRCVLARAGPRHVPHANGWLESDRRFPDESCVGHQHESAIVADANVDVKAVELEPDVHGPGISRGHAGDRPTRSCQTLFAELGHVCGQSRPGTREFHVSDDAQSGSGNHYGSTLSRTFSDR